MSAFGYSRKNGSTAHIIRARPDGDFFDGAEAAETQAASFIHPANVDAGGGEHEVRIR